MVTKGIIKNKIVDSNKYLIEIPYLSQSSVSNNDVTNSVLEATLSHTPGIINSYNEGDVVFVTFEDDRKDKPIILGKLLLDEVTNRGYSCFNSINVKGNTTLSANTIIGNFNFNDIQGVLADIETNALKIKELELEPTSTIKIIDLRP